MSTISLPPPPLPESLFSTRPISWGESANTEAAALISLMISDCAKPVCKGFRITLSSSRLAQDIHARHGMRLYDISGGSLFVFSDFSAVFTSSNNNGLQFLYPRPLAVVRRIRAVKSSVLSIFNTPVGVVQAVENDEHLAQDIEDTLNAVASDWDKNPEFDLQYKAGGCNIPWVSAVKMSEDYQFILDEINRSIRAFEVYAGTRVGDCSGRFRTILPNGDPSPLVVEANFPDASTAARRTLKTKFKKWISDAMGQNAAQQVWVSKDWTGRPKPQRFKVPNKEVTAHELIERVAKIKALFDGAT